MDNFNHKTAALAATFIILLGAVLLLIVLYAPLWVIIALVFLAIIGGAYLIGGIPSDDCY